LDHVQQKQERGLDGRSDGERACSTAGMLCHGAAIIAWLVWCNPFSVLLHWQHVAAVDIPRLVKFHFTVSFIVFRDDSLTSLLCSGIPNLRFRTMQVKLIESAGSRLDCSLNGIKVSSQLITWVRELVLMLSHTHVGFSNGFGSLAAGGYATSHNWFRRKVKV